LTATDRFNVVLEGRDLCFLDPSNARYARDEIATVDALCGIVTFPVSVTDAIMDGSLHVVRRSLLRTRTETNPSCDFRFARIASPSLRITATIRSDGVHVMRP